MNMMFSKEGAVRFSFVVVAESAALIPLYTLLPLKKLGQFPPFWELCRVRRGERLLFWL
jgi:hypothetical protein